MKQCTAAQCMNNGKWRPWETTRNSSEWMDGCGWMAAWKICECLLHGCEHQYWQQRSRHQHLLDLIQVERLQRFKQVKRCQEVRKILKGAAWCCSISTIAFTNGCQATLSALSCWISIHIFLQNSFSQCSKDWGKSASWAHSQHTMLLCLKRVPGQWQDLGPGL